jgi:hypothetical protein
MTIYQRRGSTVFNRFNFTIMDIIKLSEAIPTNYTTNDFFTFFDIIFALNQSDANYWETVQYSFLLAIQTYIGNSRNRTDSDNLLQEFMATPIVLFNNLMYGGPVEGLGKTATLAVPGYRVFLLIRFQC